MHAGAVFYGDSDRPRMASDADDMWRRMDKGSMWAWVFCAVARVNSRTWEQTGRRVEIGWKAIVKMQGTDCEAGTVAAALWMGRAIVRLACTHDLLPVEEVPGDVQVECGVRLEDVQAARDAANAAPVPPAPKPKPGPKHAATAKGKDKQHQQRPGTRKRKNSKVVNLDQLGGPVQKIPRDAVPDFEDTAGESRGDDNDDGPGKDTGSAADAAGPGSPAAAYAGMGGASGELCIGGPVCAVGAYCTARHDVNECRCVPCSRLYNMCLDLNMNRVVV